MPYRWMSFILYRSNYGGAL